MMRLWPLVAVTLVSACSRLPLNSDRFVWHIVKVGNGPEDMVLDTQGREPRLLISCNARRKNETAFGEIVSYHISSGRVDTLMRINDPALPFNPHGIDLVKVNDSLILLVVNHRIPGNTNTITRYLVKGDSLWYLNEVIHPLITSPNDVCGLSDGSFIVSNDGGSDFLGSLFGVRNSRAVHCQGNNCTELESKVSYGNGVTAKNGYLYRAAVTANKVYRYRLENNRLGKEELFAQVPGPDNFSWHGDTLIVAAHLRFGRFLKHMNDPADHSPTAVYRLDTRQSSQKNIEPFYCDDGHQLDAASTAIIFGNKLFAAGVFDEELLIATIR